MRGARAAALLLGLGMSLLLGGCAALKAPAPQAAPAAAAASAPPPTTRLEVQGPPALATLLERHLDLARVGRIAREDAVDDVEWQRLLDAAPAQARELLQTEGYFAPVVSVESLPAAPGERAVRLLLEPGPRTEVQRVTVEVEGELERAASAGDPYAQGVLADLRRGWALPPGATFRNADWSAAKANALARLRAAGYATATWSGTAAEVDAAQQQVRLFVVADSGPLFRFGELKIEGLAAHDEETVAHLAGLDPGTPLAEAVLLDYQERLQKSGLFDGVAVTLEPDPERAANARVLVRLREAALQVWTVGVGVSANTGPRASVEHLYRRVFGYALTARNKLELGGLRRAWDGELSTHPGEGFYRNLLGGSIEWLESDSDIVLSQRLRLGRTQDTQRIERLYFVEAERSARDVLTEPRTRTTTVATSLNYHGVWRQLDSVVLPTEGFSLSAQGNVGRAHGSASESGPFSRVYARLTGYLPIGRQWYGSARVEAGQVFKKEAVAVPESQLFRAGGDDSVRGYSYRSLGPVVDGAVSGGTSLLTGSVELARPVSERLPSVWGAVFVDAGQAANGFGELQPALGAGVGVRWRSPVGPLRLDWAYGREVKRSRIHFSVGIAF